jgi:hypothetical protein
MQARSLLLLKPSGGPSSVEVAVLAIHPAWLAAGLKAGVFEKVFVDGTGAGVAAIMKIVSL